MLKDLTWRRMPKSFKIFNNLESLHQPIRIDASLNNPIRKDQYTSLMLAQTQECNVIEEFWAVSNRKKKISLLKCGKWIVEK